MSFLKIDEGVYVNTANILKFEINATSVVIHLVGRSTPVALVADDPEGVAKWMAWLTPNTVNVADAKEKV